MCVCMTQRTRIRQCHGINRPSARPINQIQYVRAYARTNGRTHVDAEGQDEADDAAQDAVDVAELLQPRLPDGAQPVWFVWFGKKMVAMEEDGTAQIAHASFIAWCWRRTLCRGPSPRRR